MTSMTFFGEIDVEVGLQASWILLVITFRILVLFVMSMLQIDNIIGDGHSRSLATFVI